VRLQSPARLNYHIDLSSLLINDDIDAIIQRGEDKTSELNGKYEGLSFDDLNNFKSDTTVQQWEGEDFRSGVSAILWRNMLYLQQNRERTLDSSWNRPNVKERTTIPSKVTTKRP
jgi:SWI/SNF-related matrix-associated actin-dependent regulator of chromatin subfamily A member 5